MASHGSHPRRENRRNWAENRQKPLILGGGLGPAFEVDLTVARVPPVALPTPGQDLLGRPDSASPYEVVASAVGVAVDSLESLQAGLLETADTFRHGDAREANRRLVRVVSGLRLLTTLADMAARAARLNLTALNTRESGAGPLDAMGEALDLVFAQHFSNDHRAMAETIRERLVPALGGWREVFAEILVHADFQFRERAACS